MVQSHDTLSIHSSRSTRLYSASLSAVPVFLSAYINQTSLSLCFKAGGLFCSVNELDRHKMSLYVITEELDHNRNV